MRARVHLQIVFGCALNVLAQSAAPPQPTLIPPRTPPVAYETATLPNDAAQAWSMLQAASGLGDDTLQPWVLHAHYKTYDAYGKPKGSGTLEYVWVGPQRSHTTFVEQDEAISRWETEGGIYTKVGRTETPQYPASMILEEFLHPLTRSKADAEASYSYTAEKFGNVPASCFTKQGKMESGAAPPFDLRRACTVLNRPLLLLKESSYDVFFQQPTAFQHKMTAHKILIRDERDPVVEVEVDLLRTATSGELEAAQPPVDATLHSDGPANVTEIVAAGHLIRKVQPSYPEDAERRRVQGTVRLKAVIDFEGHIRNLEVLHSPDPMLTDAAEAAAKRWTYKPYLINGKPVEVITQLRINFSLAR